MTGPGTDARDPELLLAVIRTSPDMTELLRWAALARTLERDGRIVYPLRTVDDLAPLFAAARRPLDLSQDEIDRIRRSIPPAAFPVEDETEFLRKTRAIIDLVHGFVDPDDVPRKMR